MTPPSSAPAPAERRRLGCWGIGAITCGSLLLIFAVFTGVIVWSVRPHLTRIFASVQLTAACTLQLQTIHRALDRYQRAKGADPASLTELYPEFVSRRSVFHCPADERPASTVSYQYIPPPASRSGSPPAPDTLILICDHHRVELMGQTATNRLLLSRDGRVRQVTRMQTVPGRRGPG